MENNKNIYKSLIINSRRTPNKNLLLKFDDFFDCFFVQNRFICSCKAVFQTDSNRTFMELKYSR